MKKFMVSMLLLFTYFKAVAVSAITYDLGGHPEWPARFGDYLLRYCHVRWVAYKHKIPVLYAPFVYSSNLALSEIHRLNSKHRRRFSRVIYLHNPLDIAKIRRNGKTLYILDTFFSYTDTWSKFDIDWRNQKFISLLKEEIKPKTSLGLLTLPKDRVTIAIHIRKGAGYDRIFQDETKELPFADLSFPLKFPPISYYATQLKKICELLEDNLLYVHIFTDDSNPARLVERLKQEVGDPRIKFGFRMAGNHHTKNVLEDFFSMVQFDCMIRPDSFFSLIASKLGNFRIVIWPSRYHWQGKSLYIDDVVIERKAG